MSTKPKPKVFVLNPDVLKTLKEHEVIFSTLDADGRRNRFKAIVNEFNRYEKEGFTGISKFLRLVNPSFPKKRDTIEGVKGYKNHPLYSAFNYARNGAFSNTIGALIDTGITTKLLEEPPSFLERFNKHLVNLRLGVVQH